MGPIEYLIHSEYSMLETTIPLDQWFILFCYDLFAHERLGHGKNLWNYLKKMGLGGQRS